MQDHGVDKSLLKEADSYSLANALRPGTYLDVKDSYGTWYLAQATEIFPNALRVHFDGWSHKYDEVIFLLH